MCFNGPNCTWKPRCRYVHPEDGEFIPPRADRQVTGLQSRVPGGEERRDQGFVLPEINQPPPGLTMGNYPALGQPMRASVFRMNPQHSQ